MQFSSTACADSRRRRRSDPLVIDGRYRVEPGDLTARYLLHRQSGARFLRPAPLLPARWAFRTENIVAHRRFLLRRLALLRTIGLLTACADTQPTLSASRAVAVAASTAARPAPSAAASAAAPSDGVIPTFGAAAASPVTASDPNAALLATISAATPLAISTAAGTTRDG